MFMGLVFLEKHSIRKSKSYDECEADFKQFCALSKQMFSVIDLTGCFLG